MTPVELFYGTIPEGKSQTEKILYFMYFLSADKADKYVTAQQIQQCFADCHLTTPVGLAARLNEFTKKTKNKPAKLIRHPKETAYKLERHAAEVIGKSLGVTVETQAVDKHLMDLMGKITESNTRGFLDEAVKCYRIEAYRAATILMWCLAMDHMFQYVLKTDLKGFNTALQGVTGKNFVEVKDRDGFGLVNEQKILEALNNSRIISKDVKKSLDAHLGTRNSAAHPNVYALNANTFLALAKDLIENVILKYPL